MDRVLGRLKQRNLGVCKGVIGMLLPSLSDSMIVAVSDQMLKSRSGKLWPSTSEFCSRRRLW